MEQEAVMVTFSLNSAGSTATAVSMTLNFMLWHTGKSTFYNKTFKEWLKIIHKRFMAP